MEFIQFTIIYVIAGIGITLGVNPSEEISLSPSTWPKEEYQRLETISLRKNPRPKPLAFSDVEGLVAGTTSALAVHAGADALRKGGNAMDACIATAMADIPLTAGAKVSFAGVANILYYDHVTGKVHNLDAGWKIPRNRNQEQIPSLETLGDSVLVPGFLAGMFEAAEFSVFPLSTLLEPALFFAEQGFKVPHSLSKLMKKYYDKHTLLKTDKGSKIFTNPRTNKPYEPTELFRQPQLAKFIRNIQKQGKNYFYRGKWAKKMLGIIKAHGGYMNANDMAHYEAKWLEPASTEYNGYHVITTGADWGGVELIEMLKIMDLAGLTQTNDTYLTNATKLLSLISISRYSQFISAYLHANPEAWEVLHQYFHIDTSRKGRMSNASAKAIMNHLSNQEGLDMISELITELLTSIPDVDRHREHRRGSSGIVAMDKEGNVCSMSHTSNTRPWGTGLFVQGVALPHSGAVLRDMVSRGQPGSRIPSGLQPVIIFKKNSNKNHSSYSPSKRSLPSKEEPAEQENNHEILENNSENIKKKVVEPIRKPGGKHPKSLLSHILKKKRKGYLHVQDFIRGQHDSKILDGLDKANPDSSPDLANETRSKEINSSVEATNKTENQEQTDITVEKGVNDKNDSKKAEYKNEWESVEATNKTENQEQTDITVEKGVNDKNDSKKAEYKNEWESEWEKHWRNEPENEFEENEDENELDEWDEWDEWEKENETESEYEEENENEKEFPDSEYQVEPETIGSLFDINEINSNQGYHNSNDTARKDSSSQYTVKNWFRNLVQKLLEREDNKLSSEQTARKNYIKKRRNRQLKPVAAFSVIGQSATEAILQYINNLLDNRMDPKQASETPMFFSSTPGSSRQDVRLERFSFDQNVINGVRSRGQNVSEVMYKVGRVIAGLGAVLTVKDKRIYGCSHPDSEGLAEGH